jgi:hypothetical protein
MTPAFAVGLILGLAVGNGWMNTSAVHGCERWWHRYEQASVHKAVSETTDRLLRVEITPKAKPHD